MPKVTTEKVAQNVFFFNFKPQAPQKQIQIGFFKKRQKSKNKYVFEGLHFSQTKAKVVPECIFRPLEASHVSFRPFIFFSSRPP